MANTKVFIEKIEKVRALLIKLNNGKLSMEELDALVLNSRDIYERSVILQFRAFEEKVFEQVPPVIETVLDEPIMQIEQPKPELETELFSAEEPSYDLSLFDEPEETPVEPETPEISSAPEIIQPIAEPENPIEETWIKDTSVAVESTPLPENNDAVTSMITALDRELAKHTAGHLMPKLDTLVGAFGLNERLQFINELFGGSSEDFTLAVADLDRAGVYTDALAQFAQIALARNWTSDNETVLDLLTKVKRRHA